MRHNNPFPINRRRFLQWTAGTAAATALSTDAFAELVQTAAKKKRNVLFIAVDDLKPLLGCYGNKMVKSPNIDGLAACGMVFSRAYCQQAVCAPSRNSLLTGKRPDTIGIYDLQTHFRTKLPDVVTLPQYFKQSGWHTESLGKIFHTAHGNYDDARSWSVPSQETGPVPDNQKDRPDAYKEFSDAGTRDNDDYFEAREFASTCGLPEPQQDEPTAAKPGQPPTYKNGPPTGMPNVADSDLFDGKLADLAIKRLEDFQAKNKLPGETRPFFLAVGFHKPHLPFIAPKKYWDMYQRDQFTPEPSRDLPQGAPQYAGHGTGEATLFQGVPKQGPVSNDLARELIHGYHACVSYVDAQVGRILAELDKQGLRDNTIVILWGDHGWHLGDHGQWAKQTNFENAAHAPLIISVPRMKNAGQKCDALVEFVDIYPSLVEVAGLKTPSGLEGTSFAPLLADPRRPWKTAAFHVWPRRIKNVIVGEGRAMRTDRYRLCEWTLDDKTGKPAMELYDFVADPGETVNLASKPENAELVAQLAKKLHAGWRAALPPASAKG